MPKQKYRIEIEQADDSRWIAEILNYLGYGLRRYARGAIANAEVIAFRVIVSL